MKIRRFESDVYSTQQFSKQDILDKIAETISKEIKDDKIINANVELRPYENYMYPRYYAVAIVSYRS